jgi:hypothetical protein
MVLHSPAPTSYRPDNKRTHVLGAGRSIRFCRLITEIRSSVIFAPNRSCRTNSMGRYIPELFWQPTPIRTSRLMAWWRPFQCTHRPAARACCSWEMACAESSSVSVAPWQGRSHQSRPRSFTNLFLHCGQLYAAFRDFQALYVALRWFFGPIPLVIPAYRYSSRAGNCGSSTSLFSEKL